MKRPPGLWILLSAGVLWLSLADVYGIRASSLVFGKTTTTTTTTTTTVQPNEPEEEGVTTELSAEGNETKPVLTGIPQIDYVWDPNLPKELNGYNLSDYPFYERVPKDIDFKCDGLHDGFYASVKHKCQVYHHCLFGTRYDFLCANYTAFDQTLFNCNFVSNVDCVNSKNFWHRNDELYVTQSTTTPAPVVYNFHTQAPPQGYPLTASPLGQTIPQQLPPVGVLPVEARRRPRPAVRRRPQYDYYDDEDYEDLPRTVMMNRRKRPRPRPIYYDDEYDEFEDDRFDRRGGGRRRRPYDRRPMRRDPDRRRGYDDEEEEDRFADFTLGKKQKENKPRKHSQDYDEHDERLDKRRPHTRRDEKPTRKTNKRPIEDDYEDYEDTNSRSTTNYNKRQKPQESKKTPRLGVRRPPSEHFEDDLQQADDSPSSERTRKSNKEGTYKKPPEDTRAIIKPVSGTIYDIPRVAPRINLPVPKNAANKFAYKSIATQAPAVQSEEEYDEDEEEEEVVLKPVKTSSTTEKESTSGTRTRSKNTGVRSSDNRRTKNQNSETSTTITSTTTDLVTEKPAVVRKYKRPFLPSRGGSPYAARNLQPVGEKAIVPAEEANYSDFDEDDEIQEGKPDKKPAPVRVKSPAFSELKFESSPDDFKVTPFRIKVPVRIKSTTETPQTKNRQIFRSRDPQELNEADILNENYDESLNEAISPVLPHRDYPTGFSSSSDYAHNNRFQRPSKYVYLDPLVTADGSLYVK